MKGLIRHLLKTKYEGRFVFMQKESSTIGTNDISIMEKYIKKGYKITIVKKIDEFVKPCIIKKNKNNEQQTK